MKRWPAAVAAMVLGLVLGGCVPRYYIEQPATEAGRICAASCGQAHAQCTAQAQLHADSESSSCDGQQANIARACDGIADAAQRHRCEGARGADQACVAPVANFAPCTRAREQCVLECGGRTVQKRTPTAIPVY